MYPARARSEPAPGRSRGQSFQPLPVEGPAEVQTLVEAFNRMVAAQSEQQATARRYAVQML